VPEDDSIDAAQDVPADEVEEEIPPGELEELLAAEAAAGRLRVPVTVGPSGPAPRRVNWRGVVTAVIGIAFAANVIISYEGAWKVLPSQVAMNEPRVGISKRSEGRYLVVSGDLFDVKEAIGGGHYGLMRDKALVPGFSMGPVIAVYFGPEVEAPAEGQVTASGRVVRLQAEAGSLYRRFDGGVGGLCLVAGSGRWRSWYFWGAVLIAVWGGAILGRSIFVGVAARVDLEDLG